MTSADSDLTCHDADSDARAVWMTECRFLRNEWDGLAFSLLPSTNLHKSFDGNTGALETQHAAPIASNTNPVNAR